MEGQKVIQQPTQHAKHLNNSKDHATPETELLDEQQDPNTLNTIPDTVTEPEDESSEEEDPKKYGKGYRPQEPMHK